MNRPLSTRFATRLGPRAGIVALMQDMGEALSTDRDMLMLGGGNPGRIPAMQAEFRDGMAGLLASNDAFDRLIGDYGPPGGEPGFIEALAGLLRTRFGFDVGPENIALTNGAQNACFILFNLLAGEVAGAASTRIEFPLAPEYVGYADQALGDGVFRSRRPQIQMQGAHRFKYRVDFDALELDERSAAVCVSRPTNPTGNVLTDEELDRLRGVCRDRGVPLIVDSAYGTPFPGIVFRPATPVWDEDMILLMSLSKLGLAGVRTGIVIARPELIRAMGSANAIVNLTPGGFGPALVTDLVRSGRILALSEGVIRPFYRDKVEAALAILDDELRGYPWRSHVPEGAIFLWLWFPELPVTATRLYERLKQRGVLVIPGEPFFPGLAEPWEHASQCIRVSYAQDEAVVEEGLRRIASEVRALHDAAT